MRSGANIEENTMVIIIFDHQLYIELINSKVAKDLTSLITKVSLNNKKTVIIF